MIIIQLNIEKTRSDWIIFILFDDETTSKFTIGDDKFKISSYKLYINNFFHGEHVSVNPLMVYNLNKLIINIDKHRKMKEKIIKHNDIIKKLKYK